jgi:hypothetical protein
MIFLTLVTFKWHSHDISISPTVSVTPLSLKEKKMASWMHSAVVEPTFPKKHFILELVLSWNQSTSLIKIRTIRSGTSKQGKLT